ncbi:MAG: sigma-70 family RNA polymerase sigma factor [Verrucomicrobia bacterium]|nr:sigma-70 family RNA polymerase sigma factor [Verrucomicrobiota bacterium]
MDNEPTCDVPSDDALIAAINDGDPAAFETLYYRYCDWVVNLAYRFTQDRHLALDVMQETFLYFLKKFPGFRATAQLKTFLYPCVRDKSIAALRKARRCQSSPATAAELEAIQTVEPASGAAADLEALLAGLTDEHREVLWLRFVGGLRLNEIAQAVGLPLGTVKSRLHHALRSLRRIERCLPAR